MKTKKLRKVLLTYLLLFFIVSAGLLSSACSSKGISEQEGKISGDKKNLVVGDFTGPYAEEFNEDYLGTQNDFTKLVLMDGIITDEEFIESENKYKDCLEDFGYKIEIYKDGSSSLMPPDSKKSKEDLIRSDNAICQGSSGYPSISSLYRDTRRNPDNQDITAITVECMIKKGIVSKDYTVYDYENEMQKLSESITEDTKAHMNTDEQMKRYNMILDCENDPLGILGE